LTDDHRRWQKQKDHRGQQEVIRPKSDHVDNGG
jgi:hypothetical protein